MPGVPGVPGVPGAGTPAGAASRRPSRRPSHHRISPDLLNADVQWSELSRMSEGELRDEAAKLGLYLPEVPKVVPKVVRGGGEKGGEGGASVPASAPASTPTSASASASASSVAQCSTCLRLYGNHEMWCSQHPHYNNGQGQGQGQGHMSREAMVEAITKEAARQAAPDPVSGSNHKC